MKKKLTLILLFVFLSGCNYHDVRWNNLKHQRDSIQDKCERFAIEHNADSFHYYMGISKGIDFAQQNEINNH